ncbi:MAG: hypothetical protein ACOYMN_25515 [Roseimicrobium sp.]
MRVLLQLQAPRLQPFFTFFVTPAERPPETWMNSADKIDALH